MSIERGERWTTSFSYRGSIENGDPELEYFDVEVVDGNPHTGSTTVAYDCDRVSATHISRLPEFLDMVEDITELAMAGAGENREQERLVEAVIRRLGDFRTGRDT